MHLLTAASQCWRQGVGAHAISIIADDQGDASRPEGTYLAIQISPNPSVWMSGSARPRTMADGYERSRFCVVAGSRLASTTGPSTRRGSRNRHAAGCRAASRATWSCSPAVWEKLPVEGLSIGPSPLSEISH